MLSLLGVCVEGVEVGGFVHVDPQGIDIDSGLGVEERSELLVPVVLGIGVEPVAVQEVSKV